MKLRKSFGESQLKYYLWKHIELYRTTPFQVQMEIENIIKIFTGLFLMVTLIIAFVVRMKLGNTKTDDTGVSRKMRRNTLLTMAIVLIFLAYWIRTILSGRLIEEGITGWKVYALLALLLMGLLSLFFLLYGQFKRK